MTCAASDTIASKGPKMSDSLLGTIIGSAGALLAFVMRLILGSTQAATRLLILKHQAQMEQEFRRLEHRITKLETQTDCSDR